MTDYEKDGEVYVWEGSHNHRRCVRSCSRPWIQAPLCGSDGVTYKNRCKFNKARCLGKPSKVLKIAEKGACKQEKDQNGPIIGWMLLDTAADLASLKMVEPECPLMCSKGYKPVCASNDRTFSNECALNRHICQYPEDKLSKKGNGPCHTK